MGKNYYTGNCSQVLVGRDAYRPFVSYELQISPSSQRAGLGGFFMQCLTTLCQRWHMDKIMLTVLKGLETVCIQLLRGMLTRSLVNERASRFYQAMGYVTLSLTR